jgi:uncharacterized protein (TIGR04255 family)
MEQAKLYNNPPIILSGLQINFEKIEDFNVDVIQQVAKNIEEDYPIFDKAIVQNVSINDNGGSPKFLLEEKTVNQIRIVSENKKKAFIIERNKFIYQNLEEYKGLDELLSVFVSFWMHFSEKFKIDSMNRISLRHVNRFKLPLDIKSLNDYFTTSLKDDVNTHKISDLQFRFTQTDNENKLLIRLGHSMEKPIAEYLPYIVDIDVIKLGLIENEKSEILDIFDTIRVRKNNIFESGLTEKAKKLIE